MNHFSFMWMAIVLISAICMNESIAEDNARPVMQAIHVEVMPEIDGKLNEIIWQKTPSYTLSFSKDKTGKPKETASVKLAWNKQGLYLAVQLEDSDLLAYDDRDEEMHFKYGDALELFVKPRDNSYYWEMYVTPRSNKTTIFIFRSISNKFFTDPLKGHDFRDLKVCAVTQGSLNDISDSDKDWTAEMWVPASYMKHFKEPWGPNGNWTVFCGRYNYTKDLDHPELSMYPPISKTNYHLTKEYALLQFLK